VATLKTLDYSVLQQCMHCGLCLPTCPTYVTTKRERNSPRGRIALMRAVADGDLAIGPAFAEEMSYCLGCLACQTACPAGVNYAELFETARSDIETQGIPRGAMRKVWRGLTLRFLFLHPRALRALGSGLRVVQYLGLDLLARRLKLPRLLPAALQRLEPQTPRMSAAFSNALIAAHEEPALAPLTPISAATTATSSMAKSSGAGSRTNINTSSAPMMVTSIPANRFPIFRPVSHSVIAVTAKASTPTMIRSSRVRWNPPAGCPKTVNVIPVSMKIVLRIPSWNPGKMTANTMVRTPLHRGSALVALRSSSVALHTRLPCRYQPLYRIRTHERKLRQRTSWSNSHALGTLKLNEGDDDREAHHQRT
jgi:ferredoxin